jgi:hypothetical protein
MIFLTGCLAAIHHNDDDEDARFSEHLPTAVLPGPSPPI